MDGSLPWMDLPLDHNRFLLFVSDLLCFASAFFLIWSASTVY
jgi:hypothetical protein